MTRSVRTSRSSLSWASKALGFCTAIVAIAITPRTGAGQEQRPAITTAVRGGVWANEGARPYLHASLGLGLSERTFAEGSYYYFADARSCGDAPDCSESAHALTAGLRFEKPSGAVRPFGAGFAGIVLRDETGGIAGASVGALIPLGAAVGLTFDGSAVWTGSGDSAGAFLASSLGVRLAL